MTRSNIARPKMYPIISYGISEKNLAETASGATVMRLVTSSGTSSAGWRLEQVADKVDVIGEEQDMMPTQCVYVNCEESASNELLASNTASHVKYRRCPSQTLIHVDDL
jgi:hypothetical protein